MPASGWNGLSWSAICGSCRGFHKFEPLLPGDARLKASPASGFVRVRCAHEDQFFRFDQPLRMLGGVATSHTDGQHFGNGFRYSQQFGHGCKWPAHVVRIESGDNNLFTAIGEFASHFHQLQIEEVRFIDTDDLRPPVNLLEYLLGRRNGI